MNKKMADIILISSGIIVLAGVITLLVLILVQVTSIAGILAPHPSFKLPDMRLR